MIGTMSRAEPHPVSWAPPPLDDCDEDRMTVGLDEANTLAVRRILWNGQLVGYAIVWARSVAGRSLEMVCIDTMNHGCVHRHDGDHATPYKQLRPINTQADVQESFHEAYDEVYNAYLTSMGLEPLR